LQFEPFNGGHVNNMLFQDSVVFGSKNTGLQINALNDATIEHSYIMAQGKYPTRYPRPAGTDTAPGWALNGGGGQGAMPRMKLRNSTIVGGWTISASGGVDYPDTVSEVTNVTTEQDHSSKYPGTYNIYPTLNDDNFESLTGLTRPGTPDVDYSLSAIWSLP
jgi:hypothetical protein